MLHNDYVQRRKKLLSALDNDAIAIVVAAPEVTRNGDAHYPFRQNSDFYYLTGFSEPEAVAIFAPGSHVGDFILFNRPKDKTKALWEGELAGQEGAHKDYGANSAFSITDIEDYLPKLMRGRSKIYYDLGVSEFDHKVLAAMNQLRHKSRAGVKAPCDILSLNKIVHEFRLKKSPYEIEQMRYAVDVSVAAHKAAMQGCKPGLMEYQLAAKIHYEFQKRGCHTPAYTSIVGSGKNSCVLHYIANNTELKDGDLVLIDAGAEFQNYAADITRTFPINGTFSPEQKAIYDIVLQCQKVGIQVAKPGTPWNGIQEAIVKVLTAGLVELGLLTGKVSELIEQKAYLPFYMHNSSHWLGLDVHDAGAYKVDDHWRALEAGMVITVEPGIYIAEDMPNVDKKWWNIGIRIEDDVLITESGNDVLSKDLPKEIADIEALMSA